MLYLTRKRDESIVINDQITITVLDIKRNHVRIGLEFPREMTVLRKEVYDQLKGENQEAQLTDLTLLSDLHPTKPTSKDDSHA